MPEDEAPSWAHRPIAWGGACHRTSVVASTYQLVLRVGSAFGYAHHQLPLPSPGTGRGFLVFLRGWDPRLSRGSDRPLSHPFGVRLAWDLRLLST